MKKHDVIIIGAGACGMICAIKAARDNKKVLLLEKLSRIGAKLRATGGGRCNLTNTQEIESFMKSFGKNGRFMTPALRELDQNGLRDFFSSIGVETHAPDGFRVFPTSHNSSTIIEALELEMKKLDVEILCNKRVKELLFDNENITGVSTEDETYLSSNVVIATGGLGYPTLGSEGDGYELATSASHHITSLHPAMMPLFTKESWVSFCKADTIAKAQIKIDLPREKKITACGDLIFTNSGIRGPVVLDFAREITPFLAKYAEVPILINLTKGLNEEQIREHFKKESSKNRETTILELLKTLIPLSVAHEFCKLADIEPSLIYSSIDGKKRDSLIKLLAWTPLTIIGHEGFKMAMITRGGISLKEIDPDTMQSRLIKGLYFCGEVVDLDGPCGGYNLQWAFSSGYLAGMLKSKPYLNYF